MKIKKTAIFRNTFYGAELSLSGTCLTQRDQRDLADQRDFKVI